MVARGGESQPVKPTPAATSPMLTLAPTTGQPTVTPGYKYRFLSGSCGQRAGMGCGQSAFCIYFTTFMSTLAFAPTVKTNPLGKSQRAVSAYSQTINNSNTFYIEKQDS